MGWGQGADRAGEVDLATEAAEAENTRTKATPARRDSRFASDAGDRGR
jgi:hypothetical protein